MDQKKIDRINFLARKKKAEGLTCEEAAEQQQLRSEYVAAFKASLVNQLESIRIVEPDGTKHKIGKKMKILISDYWTLTQSGDVSLDVFKKFGDVTFKENIGKEELLNIIGDYDAVLCNKTLMTKEVFDRAKNLKYIGVFATGYNNIDMKAAAFSGVTVCNAGNYSTDAVAQQTFAYILEHFNRISEYDALVKQGMWQKSRTFSILSGSTDEIADKTIGIIGYGNIGRRVADIALAFNMNVLVYNRSKRQDERVRFVGFDELLTSSDIVTVHCPLNDDSLNMFNAAAFGKMKKGALFINTARGPLVVEEDLYAALESGRIYAALDVLRTEPMAESCVLKDAPNIFITPHTAWAPLTTRKRLINISVSNLENYLKGTPTNVVK